MSAEVNMIAFADSYSFSNTNKQKVQTFNTARASVCNPAADYLSDFISKGDLRGQSLLLLQIDPRKHETTHQFVHFSKDATKATEEGL